MPAEDTSSAANVIMHGTPSPGPTVNTRHHVCYMYHCGAGDIAVPHQDPPPLYSTIHAGKCVGDAPRLFFTGPTSSAQYYAGWDVCWWRTTPALTINNTCTPVNHERKTPCARGLHRTGHLGQLLGAGTHSAAHSLPPDPPTPNALSPATMAIYPRDHCTQYLGYEGHYTW